MSFYHYEPDDDDIPEVIFLAEDETPFWTVRRVLMVIITLLVLIAFLTYVFIVPLVYNQPAQHPPLTPTVLPRF